MNTLELYYYGFLTALFLILGDWYFTKEFLWDKFIFLIVCNTVIVLYMTKRK